MVKYIWRPKYVYKLYAAFLFTSIAIYLIFINFKDTTIDITKEIKIIERAIRSSYANRATCQHPNLPIDNPEIMQFYKPAPKIDCGNDLDDWVKCEKSICFVKPEISAKLGGVTCSYTDLIRKSDHRVKYGKTTKTTEPYVLQESDFVRVICRDGSGKSWFGLAYGIRDSVERSPAQNMYETLPLQKDADVPLYFNVLMFGFDSLSRNAFMRKLPRSYEYLTRTLGATILKGYNIVGDGTPQALIPILTGYTELELPDTRKRVFRSVNVDVYPMIWKKYKEAGFITSFNEDVPDIGTFTYRLNGFHHQPVDHYMRTFYVEQRNIWSNNKKFCIGHQPDHVVMLDYTKNFMAKYSDSPKFVFSFHGGLSHDSINLIGAADDDVLQWLRTLKEKNLLENTILIFMSDHGNRFDSVRATRQGKLEERLPFFSFAFPKSFQMRFPQQYNNFVENVNTLTTPFDIYATLNHILKLQMEDFEAIKGEENTRNKYGVADDADFHLRINLSEAARARAISLLELLPKNRSCADAYIEPHWCACLNWENLSLKNNASLGTLLKLATTIVDTINSGTRSFRSLCAPLELVKINWALRLRPNRDLLRFKGSNDKDGFLVNLSNEIHLDEDIYQLQVVVNPGLSLFEASVSYNLHTLQAHTRLPDISRVNIYGTQANCIYERNPELRKFCYCRT